MYWAPSRLQSDRRAGQARCGNRAGQRHRCRAESLLRVQTEPEILDDIRVPRLLHERDLARHVLLDCTRAETSQSRPEPTLVLRGIKSGGSPSYSLLCRTSLIATWKPRIR